jgi:hypothetical protein
MDIVKAITISNQVAEYLREWIGGEASGQRDDGGYDIALTQDTVNEAPPEIAEEIAELASMSNVIVYYPDDQTWNIES